MTPLVDVAFLLLTFFMLTTQFKPQEEVTIVLPSSHSDFKLPEGDVLTINIANEVAFVGPDPSKMDSTRIWMGLDSQRLRERIFKDFRELYVGKANGQVKQYGDKYMLMVSFPIPKSQLAKYLVESRTANPKLRTVIKGDRDADYGIAEDVMDVLQKYNVTRFNLVTDLARSVKQ
jgi:biopolymer transport protein ExbD